MQRCCNQRTPRELLRCFRRVCQTRSVCHDASAIEGVHRPGRNAHVWAFNPPHAFSGGYQKKGQSAAGITERLAEGSIGDTLVWDLNYVEPPGTVGGMCRGSSQTTAPPPGHARRTQQRNKDNHRPLLAVCGDKICGTWVATSKFHPRDRSLSGAGLCDPSSGVDKCLSRGPRCYLRYARTVGLHGSTIKTYCRPKLKMSIGRVRKDSVLQSEPCNSCVVGAEVPEPYIKRTKMEDIIFDCVNM
jgi:hypothetical protein